MSRAHIAAVLILASLLLGGLSYCSPETCDPRGALPWLACSQ